MRPVSVVLSDLMAFPGKAEDSFQTEALMDLIRFNNGGSLMPPLYRRKKYNSEVHLNNGRPRWETDTSDITAVESIRS